jgi:hypothetical protein
LAYPKVNRHAGTGADTFCLAAAIPQTKAALLPWADQDEMFPGPHLAVAAKINVDPVDLCVCKEVSSPHYARTTCCDCGSGRPSGRPRVSDLATY